jgi:hypothetical protein
MELYRLLRLQFLEDPAVGSIAGRAKTEVIDDPPFNLPGLVAESSELLLGWTPQSLRIREVLGQMLARRPRVVGLRVPSVTLLCPLLLSKHAYGSRVPWWGHKMTKKPK